MKKLAFCLAFMVGMLAAVAQSTGYDSYWEQNQGLTQAEPTSVCASTSTSPACGFNLNGVAKFQVCVMTGHDGGANPTILGGALRTFYYDYRDNRWKPNPSLTLTMDADGGSTNLCWPGYNAFPAGRMIVTTSGVTTWDGGSIITPSIRGVRK